MSMEYVRNYYGVPAKRGARVRYEGREGYILSCPGAYIRACFPDGSVHDLHPTWHVEYLDAEVATPVPVASSPVGGEQHG